MRSSHFGTVVSALLCVWLAPSAFGGFTPIAPPHPGEDSHAQIFSEIYGGTFVPSGSVDFSNGLLIAKRVDDFFIGEAGDPLDMGGPTGGEDDTDQTWRAPFTNAIAEARFAAFEQSFGYFLGSSGGSFQELFDVVGEGYAVTGQAPLPLIANQLLRWGRNGDNGLFSSRIADNSDNEDHMVTYQILEATGTDGEDPRIRWVVLWEDIRSGEPFEDWDFNDLVVEITAIPEPASLASFGLLALLGARRRRA
jgi:hypothetical protein